MPKCRPKFRKVWLACWVVAFCVTACGSPGPYPPPPSRPQNYIKIESVNFFPNGKEIVVGVNNDEWGGIFIMDREGKMKKWLLKDSLQIVYRSPAVSYDGSKVAFISNMHSPNGSVYIMDYDGNNMRRLTYGEAFDGWPTFSPDGKKLYFIRSQDYRNYSPMARPGLHEDDLYYVALPQGSIHRVTHEGYYRMSSPWPLPNNKEMLVFLDYHQNKTTLWVLNVANPALRWPIQPNKEKYLAYQKANPSFNRKLSYDNLYGPVLSRDGRYLAFDWIGYNEKSYAQIYLCDMQNMQAKPITNSKGTKTPADISPDSQCILFYKPPVSGASRPGRYPTNLWIMNLDGTGLKNIHLDFSAVAGQMPTAESKAGGKP